MGSGEGGSVALTYGSGRGDFLFDFLSVFVCSKLFIEFQDRTGSPVIPDSECGVI